MSQTRRLAAILAADVAGYSRLIGADEEGTLERLKALRRELTDPNIVEHHGRIVKTTGDGILIEFSSVIDALRCATEVQKSMAERNVDLPPETRIEFRIGIHQGDVVVEDGDIFGDGVNVAARLEALADPGGICVSARVQEDAAGRLELAFDDLGEKNLKNIARPVRAYRVQLTTATNEPKVRPTESGPTLTLPDKPSIAVLPFQNMSGDPEQEYFADGMVEEIITALSRIRWLFVIARNSTFTYKFELQDEVAISVAGVIEPMLEAAEIRRSTVEPTHDLTAYDLYLRALPHWTSLQKERLFLALDLVGEAIERDPQYGPALALAAHTRQFLAANDWVHDLQANRREGLDLARRALQSAADHPDVLALAGFALGHFGEDINVALGLIDRALVLNPSFARGWFLSGVGRLLAGQPDLAIEHFQTSERLNPRDRGRINSGIGMGGAHLFSRRFEDATTILLSSLQLAPDVPIGYRFLAASYAHLGRLDEAREIVKRLRKITPAVIPSVIPYRNPEHRELLLSGLRLAAGETG